MISDSVKEKIEEYLHPLKGYIGGYSMQVKRDDIEYGYSLAQQELEAKDREIENLRAELERCYNALDSKKSING